MRGSMALAAALFFPVRASAGVRPAAAVAETGRVVVPVFEPSFSQTLLGAEYPVDFGTPAGRFEEALLTERDGPGNIVSEAPSDLAASPALFSVTAAPPASVAVSGSESRSGAEEQVRGEPEAVPDPVRGAAGELVEELGKGGNQQAVLSSFYIGARTVEFAGHDYALLGPAGDKIMRRLLADAEDAIRARPGEKGARTESERLLEREIARIPPEGRPWRWIEADQRVSLVPFRKWWIDRFREGRLPSGWHIERLEMLAIPLNASIQSFYARRIIPVFPSISLGRFYVLEDSFLGDGETRATVEERLQRQGRPNVRDMGGLSFGRVAALVADLLQYPKTTEWVVLAGLLHERLASLGVAHRDIVRMVLHLGQDAFGVSKRRPSTLFTQRRMVYLVKRARAHAARSPAPAPAPASNDGDELFDRYILPFDPSSLTVRGGIVKPGANRDTRRPSKAVFVFFDSNQGTVALGISKAPKQDGDPLAQREITFWWTRGTRSKDWQRIALMTKDDIDNISVHAQFAGSEKERHPEPMLSHGRFYNELLGQLDRAVRAFLEDPRQTAEDAAFVEDVYISFRHNFGLLHSGEDLPEFTYTPVHRPPAS